MANPSILHRHKPRCLFLPKVVAVALSILALAACGGGGGGASNTAPPPNIPPPAVSAPAQTYTAGMAITLKLTNSGGAVTGCTISPDLPPGLTLAASGNTCQISGTPRASKTATLYTITASNAAGSNAVTVSITVNALAAPDLQTATAQVYTVNTAITPLSFTNNGGGLITGCTASPVLPTGLSVRPSADESTCEIIGTPRASKTATLYTITASNAAGPDTTTVSVTVNPVLPALQDASAQTYTTGTSISTLSFTNNGGGSITGCTASPVLPTGLFVRPSADSNTCELIGTPTATQAATSHRITATNPTGPDTTTVSVTVNPVLPALQDASAQTYTTGTSISTLSFTNNGGGLITGCTVSPVLPDGLSVRPSADSNTCELIGTPTATQAATSHRITATNPTGPDTATVSVTVTTTLAAPAMQNATAQTYTLGVRITPLRFTNSGGRAITGCTASPALPNGLLVRPSADESTCEITGTPTTIQVTTSYTITASNANPTSSTATVSITVNALTAPDLQDVPFSREFIVGEKRTFSFTNDGGGALTGCTASPDLPDGLTVAPSANESTCQIAGTPTTTTTQNSIRYTITASNAAGSDTAEVRFEIRFPYPDLQDAPDQIYAVGALITPLRFINRGSWATGCAASPDLPPGLTLAVNRVNIGTCEITGRPTAIQVTTSYTITATNANPTSSTATVSITVNALTAPDLQDILPFPESLTVGDGYEGRFSAISLANNGGGALTGCTASPDLPDGLTVAPSANESTCQITGTPTTTQNSIRYTITATNAIGSDTAEVRIEIYPARPDLQDASAQIYTLGVAITPLRFTNDGGAITNCTVSPDLPLGLTLAANRDTCEITGTPTTLQAATSYEITAVSFPYYSRGTTTLSITINPAAPVLQDAPVQFYTAGAAITPLRFINHGGGSITGCTASPVLPDELTVAASGDTCVMTGTPTATQGATSYDISAINDGGRDTAAVIVIVEMRPDAPVLANALDQVYAVNTAINPLRFTNSGGGSLTACTASPVLPDGLTVTPAAGRSTCEMTGAPTTSQTKTSYDITAINATDRDTAEVSVTIKALAAPDLQGASAQVYTEGTAIDTLSFTNSGGGSITACSTSPALPDGLVVRPSADQSTCEISGTPTEVQTATLHTITVANATGRDTANVSVTVHPALPALQDALNQTYTAGVAVALKFGNNGGGVLTDCTASTPLPNGLTVAPSADKSTCEIAGAPTTIQVTTPYGITATNVSGNDTAAVTVTVDALNAPELQNASNQVYIAGVAIDTLSFVNSGDGALTDCTASSSLPDGLTVAPSADKSTCEIIGTPAASQVATSYDITAINDAGRDMAIVSIAVNLAVIGQVTFDRVPVVARGAPGCGTPALTLCHAKTRRVVLKGATVELLSASNEVLAKTRTDNEGNYRFGITTDQPVRVRVRAELLQTASEGNPGWHVRVQDNTESNALYTLAESGDTKPSALVRRNLHAISGWNRATNASYHNGKRIAAPFAILDTVYQAITAILAVDSDVVFPKLSVNWSTGNIARSGNVAEGLIGSSHYSEGEIYLLGAEGSDTDEFDQHVIVREWVHFLVDTLSRTDSLGGVHNRRDALDMTFAFSEGFAKVLAGILLDDSFYSDTFGEGGSISFDLEKNDNSFPGWFSEASIRSILYDLYDKTDDGADQITLGLAPLYKVLINQQRTTPVATSIFTFITALKEDLPAQADNINQLVNAQRINGAQIDATGSRETNDAGGRHPVLPVYTTVTVDEPAVNLCTTTVFGINSSNNRLSSHRYMLFNTSASAATVYTINASRTSTTYKGTPPPVSEPAFHIGPAGQGFSSAYTTPASVDTLAPNQQYPLRLWDKAVTAGTNKVKLEGEACFDVSITSNTLEAPTLQDASDQIYTAEVAIAPLSFTNRGGGALTGCAASPVLPDGLTVAPSADMSTCEMTGAPTTSQAVTPYEITATNTAGSSTAEVSVAVKALVAPVLTDAPNQVYIAGEAIAPLSFTNSGHGALIGCTASPALPDGLTVVPAADRSTCEMTGTPTTSQAATPYEITATNAAGSGKAAVSVAIGPALPVLQNILLTQVYTLGVAIAPLSFTSNGGGSLTGCTASPALSAGLTVALSDDMSTCEIIGTPTTNQAVTTYRITATNASGTNEVTVSILVNSPNALPALQNAGTLVYYAGVPLVPLSVTNNGGGSLIGCALSDTSPALPDGLTVIISVDRRTCEITGTPITGQATTSHRITATNVFGSSTAIVRILVTSLGTPQLRDILLTQVYTVGVTIVPLSFINSRGGLLTGCTASPALPDGLIVAPSAARRTCEITGTPTTDQTVTIHTIIATNTVGSETTTLSIAVNGTPNAPALQNAPAQVYTLGVTITPFGFINSGSGMLTGCTVSPALQDGLTLALSANQGTCEMTGIPTIIQTTTSYTITATNAFGSDTAILSVTVNALGAPVLQNALAQVYRLGVAIAPLSFTNSGGGSITGCAASPDLPNGLTVAPSADQGTCEMTGTPTTSQAVTSHTITAFNAAGHDTATLSVTVTTALSAPALQNAPAQVYTVGVAIPPLIFTNSGGGALTACTVSPALPTGLTVAPSAADQGTCVVTGTPTTRRTIVVYRITAINTIDRDTARVSITVHFAVFGRITFDRVPIVATGISRAALDHTKTMAVAVQGVTVELIDTQGTVFARTQTNNKGDYRFNVTTDQPMRVRVRAELLQNANTNQPGWHVRVQDNQRKNALYTLAEPGTALPSANPERNLHATSGWNQAIASYNTPARTSGPFAILDTIYKAITKIVGVDPDVNFPRLNVNWSINNNPANSDTSYDRNYNLYLLGADSVNTDEFDEHIILHEWGHFFQHALSRNDSPGGYHNYSLTLDMTLAFSEGFASALAGMLLDDPILSNTLSVSGFFVNLEANSYSYRASGWRPGWYSEVSVQSILYDLYDGADDGNDQITLGLAPLYSVMINQLRTTPFAVSIFTFITALKEDLSSHANNINLLVNGQNINSAEIDATGSRETNDAGDADNVLPIYTSAFVDGSAVNLCTTKRFNPGSGNGSLSSRRYIRFETTATTSYSFNVTRTSTTYTGTPTPDSRPRLDVYPPPPEGLSVLIFEPSFGKAFSLLANRQYSMRLTDGAAFTRSIRGDACFDVSITSN